ncbi:type 2 isopentenyl-diphosphate Delta-isomerase [Dactylosporangium sp. NPDC005572]|uniref:type 2 isopentenyl-diphosphate Delta-isomerase n=1 Tax=Dactylosporangium sp. NPDC005572 TaxID=3156889 RepID=UPI0033B498F6
MATISERKEQHLTLAVALGDGQDGGPGWPDVHLVHHALPSGTPDGVDVSTRLLGRRLPIPLVIAGMTGGHPAAAELNARLARAAERTGVAMGVGSQRAALRDPSLAGTYAVARHNAPSTLLIGNVGAAQLLDQRTERALSAADLRRAVDMIGADALALHLNFIEESVQPEGQTNADGLTAAIAALCQDLDVPVLVKETGGGVSGPVAETLARCGAAALDVGGRGGTSFRAIEAQRAQEHAHATRRGIGRALAGWGIPTPVSVAWCAGVLPVVATGGIRSGVEAAKAIALGATAVSVGRPLLECAMQSEDAVVEWIDTFEAALRAALFLSGCRTLADLRTAPRVVLGDTRHWLDQLGLTGR